MESISAYLAQLMQSHDYLVPVVVGIIAFGESLVLLGLVIPATALMLAIGGLIGSGMVEPIPVIAGAIVGAVAGDIVSYWFGRWVGPRVVHRWPLIGYRSQVAQARLFFRRFGFASIFVGRFFGPVRATMPMVAGMMRMNQRRFQFANVSSAVVWAPVMLAPGWLAAESASLIGAHSEGSWLMWMGGLTLVMLLATGVVLKLVQSRIMRRPRTPRRAVQPAARS
ncbi:DedA family protein [Ancylobacter amanitiformis]|uniref:Membrane protein DedA with SNARE-associated domain n=1 Tax=Ancylobacter amanitiformis TaxID=217069 RepID=A0ABU0LRF4_9HYPH|nr:DedA family protein [Ancylobacter amanitiformis]MDQ0511285.1 membrane protein DedA with SNARE-associated domain [Ancylobacter amanitiformis]